MPGSSASGRARYLPLEQLIAHHLGDLFPGMEIVEHHAFRITRNADFEVEEDRDEDLLQALERELARRRFGSPVRLEVADDMSEHMLELLLRELDVDQFASRPQDGRPVTVRTRAAHSLFDLRPTRLPRVRCRCWSMRAWARRPTLPLRWSWAATAC